MLCVNNVEQNLVDVLDKIKSFEIYTHGNKETIGKNNDRFLKLKNNIEEVFFNSRLMPAFGVSLHEETIHELKNGVWLKLNFDSEIIKNGLLCNSLLFKLEEVQGFNLIRMFNNRFDGRCLYLDLDSVVDLNKIIN